MDLVSAVKIVRVGVFFIFFSFFFLSVGEECLRDTNFRENSVWFVRVCGSRRKTSRKKEERKYQRNLRVREFYIEKER